MSNGYEDSQHSEMTKHLDLDSCDRERERDRLTLETELEQPAKPVCQQGEIPTNCSWTLKTANSPCTGWRNIRRKQKTGPKQVEYT
jgi:hypothetical protein